MGHAEIVEFLAEEIERITEACKARHKSAPHLDEADDDFESAEQLLERWGDRRVPKQPK